MNNQFILFAHRGRNIYEPENTIEGIEEIRKIKKDLTIEIDITVTSDDIPILLHDISLNRTLGINDTVFNYSHEELNSMNKKYHIPSLKEVLNKFPDQNFLLDIRTDLHKDCFVDSSIDPKDINFNYFLKLKKALNNIINIDIIKNCQIMVGDIKHKNEIQKIFESCEVGVSERFIRTYLDLFLKTGDLSKLGNNPKRVYISISKITKQLIEMFHKENLKVIVCSSMQEYSLKVVKKSIELGADGILTGGINLEILNLIDNYNKLIK